MRMIERTDDGTLAEAVADLQLALVSRSLDDREIRCLEYSPSEFSRMITQSMRFAADERAVDAGQHARRPHVRVLVEALANRQPEAPQRDVIGHVGRADRAEENRVEPS